MPRTTRWHNLPASSTQSSREAPCRGVEAWSPPAHPFPLRPPAPPHRSPLPLLPQGPLHCSQRLLPRLGPLHRPLPSQPLTAQFVMTERLIGCATKDSLAQLIQ